MSEKVASDVEACTCSRSSRRCRCPVSAAHRGCEKLPSAGFRGSSCESDRGRPSPRWGGRDSHAQKSRSAAVSPGRFTERCTAAEWVVQQLRETFPEAGPYRYVILDRDSKFDADVITFLKATGLTPRRTSIQSPWQNGIAERWVLGCRNELLDYVIPFNEQHLRRLVREYVVYFHQDRIHDSLEKDTPNRRSIEHKPSANATVISNARLSGLHHRHSWLEAA